VRRDLGIDQAEFQGNIKRVEASLDADNEENSGTRKV
jgi:hypothetical protein